MIEVVFVLQEPGNHHQIDRRVMSCVPHAGEQVAIGTDAGDVLPSRLYTVHSVMYVLSPAEVIAWVYLR